MFDFRRTEVNEVKIKRKRLFRWLMGFVFKFVWNQRNRSLINEV
ncbi:MAG: hypothetical protein ACTS4X_01195 [Candidatus Hodgkinia cicadicola]